MSQRRGLGGAGPDAVTGSLGPFLDLSDSIFHPAGVTSWVIIEMPCTANPGAFPSWKPFSSTALRVSSRLAWRGARRQAEEKAYGLSFEAAARLTFSAAPAVEMIAAAVVAFGEIDKLPANTRRTGQAGESAQPGGHLPVMIALRKRLRRFAHGQCQNVRKGQTRRSLRTGQSSLNTGVLALRTCAVTHR
jgi:hypothetical protein